jgi:glycosyltransferase involved in cell wall biosynthesis
MKISVLIPSYNGRSKIPVLLDALNHQSFKDFETIISLDTSLDGSYEYLIQNPFQLENYSVVCSKMQKGRAANRNTAAKIATGEILLFLDDDMLPTNALVEQHIIHHEKYIDSLLTGPVPEDLSMSKEDLHKYKAHLSDKWVKDLKKDMDLRNHFMMQRILIWLSEPSCQVILYILMPELLPIIER